MEKSTLVNQPRVFTVFDAYSMGATPEGYDSNTFYFGTSGEDFAALNTHPKAHVFNIENFIGGGESVTYDAVIFAGPEICFSRSTTFAGNELTIKVVSEAELSEELKAIIVNSYSKAEYPKHFDFELGVLAKDIDTLIFNPDSDDNLESRLSKEWVDEVLQKIQAEGV